MVNEELDEIEHVMIKIIFAFIIGYGISYHQVPAECTGQPVAIDKHDGYITCVYTAPHKIKRIIRGTT